jgi:hypothetical protein
MRFHRLWTLIVLTVLWAAAAVVLRDNLRPGDPDWVRYLAIAVSGGPLIWLVGLAIGRLRRAPDAAPPKPSGLLAYRPSMPFDLRPPDRASRSPPAVIEQIPLARWRGGPLTARIALAVTGLWAAIVLAVVCRDGFDLVRYLALALPSSLLLFVIIDATGWIIEWVVADTWRAKKTLFIALCYLLFGLVYFVLYAIVVGGFRELGRAIFR